MMTYNSLVSDIPDYLDRDDARLLAQVPNFITMGQIRCARELKLLGTKQVVVGALLPGQYVYIKPNRWLQTISMCFGTNTLYATTLRARATNTVTLTFSAQHPFTVGTSISVFNVGGTAYNGNFVVTAATQFTVSYVSAGANEGSTADTNGRASQPLENRTVILPRSYEYCNEYWPDRTAKAAPKFYADYDYNNWLIIPTADVAYPYEVSYYQQPDLLSDTNQTNWFTQYVPDLLLYACLLESAPYLKDDARIQMWQERYDRSAKFLATQDHSRVDDASIERTE